MSKLREEMHFEQIKENIRKLEDVERMKKEELEEKKVYA
jgi:hypothetical protein